MAKHADFVSGTRHGCPPQEIFKRHLTSLGDRNLDGIADDYTDKSVLITAERSYWGKREIRPFFSVLLDALSQAQWALTASTFEGNTLFIEWTAKPPGHNVPEGVDMFVFTDGMIAVQAARRSLIKTKLNAQ